MCTSAETPGKPLKKKSWAGIGRDVVNIIARVNVLRVKHSMVPDNISKRFRWWNDGLGSPQLGKRKKLWCRRAAGAWWGVVQSRIWPVRRVRVFH